MCNNCVTADENFDDDDDGDDIYIMMQCVFVCNEKSSLSQKVCLSDCNVLSSQVEIRN